MSGDLWDPRISNDATMADQCMKLGAVILKPNSAPKMGFSADQDDKSPPRAGEGGEVRS